MMPPLIFGRPYGSRQISNDNIEVIRGLLATGLSQRAVSRQTGFCRGTVRRVAQGVLREVRQKNWRRQRSEVCDFGELEIFFPDDSADPSRCPGCGALVQMPCLACQIRQFRRKSLQNAPEGR